MNYTYLNGKPIHLGGKFLQPGDKAPMFHLTGIEMNDISLNDFDNRRLILNIFPSLDTEVCAMSVRRFNNEASKFPDVSILCISMDLPFAAKRFCSTHGIENVITASTFRSPLFGIDYGVKIMEGQLASLLARAIIIIGTDRSVVYSRLSRDITLEPDYDSAITALKDIQPR